jgi:hypothetical protein
MGAGTVSLLDARLDLVEVVAQGAGARHRNQLAARAARDQERGDGAEQQCDQGTHGGGP